MGKRSKFERVERDFYPTPLESVFPLLPHLVPETEFDEPCCGNGALIKSLEDAGHFCTWGSDIEPKGEWFESGKIDALTLVKCHGDFFITNPPWDRKILHPMITHLSALAPTWLLFDADWMHTMQSVKFMTYCRKIVSVGRVKWIPNTKMTGKDNAAWYLFDQNRADTGTQFFGRLP